MKQKIIFALIALFAFSASAYSQEYRGRVTREERKAELKRKAEEKKHLTDSVATVIQARYEEAYVKSEKEAKEKTEVKTTEEILSELVVEATKLVALIDEAQENEYKRFRDTFENRQTPQEEIENPIEVGLFSSFHFHLRHFLNLKDYYTEEKDEASQMLLLAKRIGLALENNDRKTYKEATAYFFENFMYNKAPARRYEKKK